MQPRAGAGREHDVVRIALALQEHEQRIVGAVRRDVFGEPEAEPHVEFQLALHVRHQHLEMVDALRHRAVVLSERDEQPRLGRHGGAEFERHAERIADMERAALIRPLHPLRRQAGLLEIMLGLLQILLGEAAHADALRLRRGGALEHQAVMTRLGDAAQIDRVLILVADDEADEIDIERAAFRQIFDVQYGMTGASDVEWRIVVRFRDGHGALQVGRADRVSLTRSGAAFIPDFQRL